MYVTKRSKFYWIFTDSQNIKGRTVQFELEYDVLDREFHCSVGKRNTPRERWPGMRAATPEELAFAKAHLSPEELAACIAESINPSIWTRASRAAADRRIASDAADALLYMTSAMGIAQPRNNAQRKKP